MRAGEVVLACGAIERPLVFAGNDCPGVMLASAVGQYLHRHAVQCGQNALFAVNNVAAYQHAIANEYRFYSYGDSSLLLP